MPSRGQTESKKILFTLKGLSLIAKDLAKFLKLESLFLQAVNECFRGIKLSSCLQILKQFKILKQYFRK